MTIGRRALGTGTVAEMDAGATDTTAVVDMLEVYLDAGTLRLCTSVQPFSASTADGGPYSWTPIGGLLSIGAAREGSDRRAAGVDLELSGISTATLATFQTTALRGRLVKVWQARVTRATGVVLETPILIGEGLLTEDVTVEVGRPDLPGQPSMVTIRTRVTTLQVDLDQQRGVQMNPSSHQSSGFSGDTFFNFLARLPGRAFYWGNRFVVVQSDLGPY